VSDPVVLVLGEDGLVHEGRGERKFGGWWAETDCDTIPLRLLNEAEVERMPDRMCPRCFEEVK
jgi:hypothetical protein